jgi:ankyrin repeat protein
MIDFDLKNNYEEVINLINQVSANQLVNFVDQEFMSTFLHLCVNKAVDPQQSALQIEVFLLLIKKGCDVNCVDGYGFTPLHYCCNYDLIQIAYSIINHKKFNPNTINLKTTKQLKIESLYYLVGSTPLQICAWKNYFELAEMLIKHGANINDKNESDWSCLHIVSRQNYLDFTRLLIKNKCNVNEANSSGKTPLHIASRHNNFLIAKELLESKAFLNCKNKYGQTPLHIGKAHVYVWNKIKQIKLLESLNRFT